MSPHRDRGGILQQVVLGAVAARGSARRGPARPTLHRRPASSVEPRRPHPQLGVARRGHEPRLSGRADGAGTATPTRRLWRPSCPATSTCAEAASAHPSCTPSDRSTAATRWAASEAVVPRRAGGTAPSRPLLQLQRRRLGLCFNCNEPYTRGHNRVCRCIFYLNSVEIVAADEEPAGDVQQEEDPVFSLRAVAGMPICDSM